MLPQPEQLGPERGAVFSDRSVASAYLKRPPYPDEVYDLLRDLIVDEPRTVLELGCGLGEVSRRIAPEVDRIDAIDPSRAMLQVGRALPGGGHPGLRWVETSAEAFDYDGPYALIVAAESIHWTDWATEFPRVRAALSANGRLAIIHHRDHVAEWDAKTLGGIVPRYSTIKDFVPWHLFDELAKRDLFDIEAHVRTKPYVFEQTVDDYLEFWHSMSGFSRDRMGDDAARFDQEVRRYVAAYMQDGVLHYEVTVQVAWGLPRGPGG